jgi:hypothetical protein
MFNSINSVVNKLVSKMNRRKGPLILILDAVDGVRPEYKPPYRVSVILLNLLLQRSLINYRCFALSFCIIVSSQFLVGEETSTNSRS